MGTGSVGGSGGCRLEPQDLGFLKNGGRCWWLQLSQWDRKSSRTCALQASEGKGLGVLQTLLGENPPLPTSLSKSL